MQPCRGRRRSRGRHRAAAVTGLPYDEVLNRVSINGSAGCPAPSASPSCVRWTFSIAWGLTIRYAKSTNCNDGEIDQKIQVDLEAAPRCAARRQRSSRWLRKLCNRLSLPLAAMVHRTLRCIPSARRDARRRSMACRPTCRSGTAKRCPDEDSDCHRHQRDQILRSRGGGRNSSHGFLQWT